MIGSSQAALANDKQPTASMFGAAGLPRVEIAALRTHPQFQTACRSAASSMVTLYQGNRLLNTLVNDSGRVVIGYMTLYLHFDMQDDDARSGLTVSRLKTMCVEQGICSAGRAEALVAVMRLFGYLEPAPDAADRRVRRLVPTAKLIVSHQERWQLIFGAVGHVRPEVNAAAAIKRTGFAPAFVRQLGEHFMAGFRMLHHSSELALFTDRNAGMMVLFSLLLGASDEGLTPTRPVAVSISALSRRFGVSRVHVRKLLRDAAAEGFIERPDGDEGPIVILPRLTLATHTFFATVFLFVAHCARAALSEIGPADTHG